MSDIRKIRNIGIIAHIDAGKTTTTERLLYYSGTIYKVGDVHHGNTTTDWMTQEKERGITIVSASTQYNWDGYAVNLIDTPGHIDFNHEVEKCLSVLDGALVVIDGSAGVEPQTECVWNQAKKYDVARIIFVNKMDKEGANFEDSIVSLHSKLSKACIPVVYPYYENHVFLGVYDLVAKTKLVWRGRDHLFTLEEFDKLDEIERGIIEEKRAVLIENLAEYDDEMLSHFLGGNEIENEYLKAKIRSLTEDGTIFPVFAGSSFHNKGVQTVLDGINTYLPSPEKIKCKAINLNTKVEYETSVANSKAVAFVFKLVNDNYAGEICYTRVYSGKLKQGDILNNSRSGRKVKIQNIIRFFVTERKQISEALAGDVVGLVINEVQTGDTLSSLDVPSRITKIDMPNAVVDFALIPASKNDQDKFAKYIGMYLKEDPTVKIRFDDEQKETVISGVGRLQIEILVDRLRTERGINVSLSKPKIGYRESITDTVVEEYLHKKQTGGAGQFAGVTLEVGPSEKPFEFHDKITRGAIPRQFIPEIEKTCKEVLQRGVLTRSPTIGVCIKLLDGRYHDVDSSTIAYSLATREALIRALKAAKPILLEPIFKVLISTPSEYLNNITGDIYSKEGNVIDVKIDNTRKTEYRTIECEVPLRNFFDYADSLRSISKGMANFTYSFHEYRKCNHIPTE